MAIRTVSHKKKVYLFPVLLLCFCVCFKGQKPEISNQTPETPDEEVREGEQDNGGDGCEGQVR